MKINIKKYFAVLLAVILAGSCFGINAFAVETGDCGESASYSLDEDGVLTISGAGVIEELSVSDNEAISKVIISDGITGIGDSAFICCGSLTEITIPDSVTSIADWAFYGCSSLTDIFIPDSVKSIGEWTFSECTCLTDIVIPDSITSIGDYAFDNVPNILYSENMKATGSPWGARCVNGYADGFLVYSDSSREKLVCCVPDVTGDIILPESVTGIEDYAFENCISLTGIVIPDGVKGIGRGTFEGCGFLTNVTIPDSVTSIGECAFYCCVSLTDITIPDSVTSIGEGAFGCCDELENVYFSGTTAEWGAVKYFTVISDENEESRVKEIDKASSDNEALINATVHCSDGIYEEPDEPEQNFFQRIFAAIKNFFAYIADIFRRCTQNIRTKGEF